MNLLSTGHPYILNHLVLSSTTRQPCDRKIPSAQLPSTFSTLHVTNHRNLHQYALETPKASVI